MKIAYYPASNATFASSRLRVWKIAQALSEMDHEVMFNEPSPVKADVVIVQKRTDVNHLMDAARLVGTPVIYDADDWIPSLPVEHADLITVDTPAKLRLWPGALVIPDALDLDGDADALEVGDDLELVVWTGNAENLYHVKHVLLACNHLHIVFLAITDLHSPALAEQLSNLRGLNLKVQQWSLSTVDSLLRAGDLFVSPFIGGGRWSEDWVQSKSANRVLKAWGLGLPVAATPIPSYVEAGLQYHATDYGDWLETLTWLRSRELRRRDADRGYRMAREFSADKVALRWLEVIEHATALARQR